MEKKSTFEDVLKIRKGSRKIIRKGNEGWLYDYTMPNGPFTYEVTFQNIIDEKWGDFLQKQKEKQGSTAAMDFMGGGTCFMNLPVDKKLAVRLTDKGSDPFFQLSLQEKELLSKIDVITGDVLSKKTWKEVFVWVEKETAGRGFDLILSRPIGGLLHITFNLDVWYFLIENLWKSLNKNRGTLYTQLPLPNYDLMSVPLFLFN
ncbi:MAG: hypothetical protein M1127_02300, partial [Patescibacteria group bacterium]|nr:hypothetical protein [Patescibacteria group bacterium]